MTSKDKEEISKIYESLDFKSSYSNIDPEIEKLKAEANDICHALEHKLEGTINYYKMHKDGFFNNPNDMNHFEALKNMLRHLREPLYPYQEFRG